MQAQQAVSGNATAGPGGDSWFSNNTTQVVLDMAKGGASGQSVNGNKHGAGGAGGAAASSIGTIKFSGGAGFAASANTTPGGGGSSAGTAAPGNNATSNTGATAPAGGGNGGDGAGSKGNAAGNAGGAPGGGGGGAEDTANSLKNGGAGAAGKVVLTYVSNPNPLSLSWRGETNGVAFGDWTTSTSSPNTNWLDTVRSVCTNYLDEDSVQFDDTLTGTNGVNIPLAVQPASVIVANVNTNYIFSGAGKISGTAGLTKLGAGMLTILTANDYSGGTTISNGILQVGSGGTIGSLTGAVTNNATLTFYRSDTPTISASISGSGVLILNGTGTQQQSGYTLTGGNSGFTGPMFLTNSRVGATTQARLGSGTVTVNSGSEVYFSAAATWTNTFYIAGHGWPETAAPAGIGALRFFGASSQLSGPVNLLGNAWLSFYEAGKVATVSGVIDNGANTYGITKGGPSTLVLTAANTYKGATVVSGGALDVLPSSLSGAGSLTISEGATLGLDVTGGGSTLNVSSLTLGGATNGIVTLNLTNGALSGNPSFPAITSAGALSAAGTNIVIVLQGSGYVEGQFPLISYAGTALNSLSNFTLAVTPAPLGFTNVLVNNTANPSIDVQIIPTVNTLTWSGANGVPWDTSTQNWTLGGNPTNYSEYPSGVSLSEITWCLTTLSLILRLTPASISPPRSFRLPCR